MPNGKTILCAIWIRRWLISKAAQPWISPQKCNPKFWWSAEKQNRAILVFGHGCAQKNVEITCPGGSIGFSTANSADEHIMHSRMTLPNVLWLTSQWQKTRNLCTKRQKIKKHQLVTVKQKDKLIASMTKLTILNGCLCN